VSELVCRRLRDQITDRLRSEILSGELAEGASVREIPLAERFKVSRGPIRDAILQLTSEGLLKARPNCGARVAPVWDEITRPVMVHVRWEIERFALKELIRSGVVDRDLTPFRENLQRFEVACRNNDFPTVVRLDMEFHRLIVRESGQPGLESVWLPIMGAMRLPYSRHKTLMESYSEHEKIVSAVERRTIKAGIAALKANIH
jgi:DNA-binding GntR family transcriptional regulator